MTPTIAILLIITFVLSTVGLLLLIWSIANNQFSHGQSAARTIFSPGEEGHSEDPALADKPAFTGDTTAQASAIKARWTADQVVQNSGANLAEFGCFLAAFRFIFRADHLFENAPP